MEDHGAVTYQSEELLDGADALPLDQPRGAVLKGPGDAHQVGDVALAADLALGLEEVGLGIDRDQFRHMDYSFRA
jgi:hypothetical protein